jgi:hypothetical protein
MGILDDAIREHLELKRRQGAPEEELERDEQEALGRGGTPPAPVSAPVEPADEEPEAFDAVEDRFGPGESAIAGPDELDAEVRGAEPGPAVAEPEAIEPEPDEVLPEEALELEPSALPEEPLTGNEDATEPPRSLAGEGPLDEADPGDDLLEETPEFLEEAPGQDRLWFEQRPPKDFDFDD